MVYVLTQDGKAVDLSSTGFLDVDCYNGPQNQEMWGVATSSPSINSMRAPVKLWLFDTRDEALAAIVRLLQAVAAGLPTILLADWVPQDAVPRNRPVEAADGERRLARRVATGGRHGDR